MHSNARSDSKNCSLKNLHCKGAMQLGPDTIGHIYELLQRAQSPQPSTQKEAEAALAHLDAQQGFSSCLAVGILRAKI